MSASDNSSGVPAARREQWRRIWEILLTNDNDGQEAESETESGTPAEDVNDTNSVSAGGNK
jgi:hypothetical protein